MSGGGGYAIRIRHITFEGEVEGKNHRVSNIYGRMNLRNSLIVLVSLFYCDAAVGGRNYKASIWWVSVADQSQLDQFINNVTSPSNRGNTSDIHLSLAGDNTYVLDIIKLMRININSSSLIIEGKDGLAKIDCTAASQPDPETLIQPLLNASLVQMDGLVFTGCPVPIMIEEASNVIIQNCVFQ